MLKIKEFSLWLWKPARLLLGLGILLAELLLVGSLGLWLFAGYLMEVSMSIALAREFFTCALNVLFSAGLTTLLMQLVYWKDIRS